MKFGAVILAAGYSSRMDSFKPLMHIGGKSLLGHCISLFRFADVDTVNVVSGYRREAVEKEVRLYNARPIYNADFTAGMFSSVCAGIEALGTVDGFFVLPVDVPLVRFATVQKLISSFSGDAVLYPFRDGVQGHPPLIPGRAVSRILEHDGCGGLQAILKRLPGKNVSVWDDCAFLDADVRNDFDNLCNHWKKRTTGTPKETETLAELLMQPRGLAHGKAVAEIASALAGALNTSGHSLNMEKVYNGALLHDVAKGQPGHEAEGGKLMYRLGLPDLAEIIASHSHVVPTHNNKITEREVVCLADKLVCGTRRISVRNRFEEKMEKYHDDAVAVQIIQQRMNSALDLQKIVENALALPIEEILMNCTLSA